LGRRSSGNVRITISKENYLKAIAEAVRKTAAAENMARA